MKINIIGGGPAGLYSAVLLKLQNPNAEIHVFERNSRDSTFGFGIVLSSETLGKLATADHVSAAAINVAFTYWDDLYVDFKGETLRSVGHGFSGLERLTLLQILGDRAEHLGVLCHWNSNLADLDTLCAADLVIAGDGVNSGVREKFASHFRPSVEMCKNRFVWLGCEKPLPGFTFMFKENEHGVWIVHAYQFKKGRSTFVVETTPETFARSGLAEQDEAATASYVQALFKDELKGNNILTNRSNWRQFPKVHCEHWYHENIVLIGDAAHTAHFSIGSGTKLALEDAISLAHSLKDGWNNVPAALAKYERDRRPRSERIQVAATISLEWFENIQRHWHLPPLQFNFSLLTRSNQISYEKLKIRDAAFVEAVNKSIVGNESDCAEPASVGLNVGKIKLPNRIMAFDVTAEASIGLFLISAVHGGCNVELMRHELPCNPADQQWPVLLAAAVTKTRQQVADSAEIGLRLPSTVAIETAVALVRAAKFTGCALVHIIHRPNFHPALEPLILCEILRGETGLPVLLSGVLETRDAINTAIAAGRVDLATLADHALIKV